MKHQPTSSSRPGITQVERQAERRAGGRPPNGGETNTASSWTPPHLRKKRPQPRAPARAGRRLRPGTARGSGARGVEYR
eukprot:scaffold47561_cov58-Phaeocystis_antarctica.AAC.4